MKTIALRFSNSFAPPLGTILAHDELISQNGFVWYGKLGNRIVMPITPTIALGLFPPSFVKQHPLFTQHRMQIVKDVAVVEIMNMYALLYEYVINNEFIIGRQKKELERLMQCFHDNKQSFERAKHEFSLQHSHKE